MPAGCLPPRADSAPPPRWGLRLRERGGRLRVGHVGAGKGESFNPGRGSSFIDASRYYNLYDPLVRVNPDFSQSPALALAWTPNATRTVWEVKLRPGVKWHDGSPFTADDVIYTLRQMGNPKHVGHASVLNIRLADVKKKGPLVVRIPLKSPDARLSDSFVQQNTVMMKNGETDFAHPIGTGPFMFKSFEVGVRSLCTRNPDYWEHGKPYVDSWEDISIDDNSARLNALLAGQIDMMSQLDFDQAKAQKSAKKIQVIDAPSPAYQVFIMRTDRPPFNDVRVRQAFRLIVDRQALINVALGGFGTPGNDLFGQGLPYFAKSLPRAQAGHRAGEVAAEERRQDQSQRDAADLEHRAGVHRSGDAARPAGAARPASRCRSRRSRRTPTSTRRCCTRR